MANLKHDNPQAHAIGSSAVRGRGIARLAGWVRRALGRESGGGMLTLTLDGKLSCESLRAEADRCE